MEDTRYSPLKIGVKTNRYCDKENLDNNHDNIPIKFNYNIEIY